MKLFFTLFWLITASTAFSQRCATEDYIDLNPYARGNGTRGPVYNSNGDDHSENETIVIPVVVHVLYNTGVQNISDRQIYSQIEALNRDFRRKNADTINTPEPFKKVAADSKIEFVLANTDMQGRPTTGIIRTYTKEKTFLADDGVKFSSKGGSDAWDASKYLNIWVCNLFGRTLGYSVLPGSPAARDGVVIKYTAFGTEGAVAAPYNKGRTATHEVGHWLGLQHIWGNGNCGDDGVDDTPPQQAANQYCTTFPHLSACSIDENGDMFMNFMDLTEDACMNLFTKGQAQKMRSVFAPGNPRNALLTSTGYNPLIEGAPLPPPEEKEDELKADVVVYPNPFVNEIKVKITSNSNKTSTIKVFNISGKLLITERVSGGIATIPATELSSGMYFIKVSSEGREKTFKLVK